MSKDATFTGGVQVIGEIELYTWPGGVIPFTGTDFANFTGGQVGGHLEYFFINNTGEQPVYVYWNISSSNLAWDATSKGYNHTETAVVKYSLNLATSYVPDPIDHWSPNEYTTPEALYLNVGEGKKVTLVLLYTGEPNTAETFTVVTTFYAENA
jgi:hypothetical protein